MLAKLSPSRLTGERWNDRTEAAKDRVEAASVLETDARPDIVVMNALCMAAQGVQQLLSENEAVGKQTKRNSCILPYWPDFRNITSSPHRPP